MSLAQPISSNRFSLGAGCNSRTRCSIHAKSRTAADFSAPLTQIPVSVAPKKRTVEKLFTPCSLRDRSEGVNELIPYLPAQGAFGHCPEIEPYDAAFSDPLGNHRRRGGAHLDTAPGLRRLGARRLPRFIVRNAVVVGFTDVVRTLMRPEQTV